MSHWEYRRHDTIRNLSVYVKITPSWGNTKQHNLTSHILCTFLDCFLYIYIYIILFICFGCAESFLLCGLFSSCEEWGLLSCSTRKVSTRA